MNSDWKQLTYDLITKEAQLSDLRSKFMRIIPVTNVPIELRSHYRRNNRRTDILKVIDDRSTEYSTQIFPAVLTRHRAPNFWLEGERSVPIQDEAWKSIYLLFSSVSVGNIFLNLDNVSKKGRIAWRNLLFSERGPSEFYRRMRDPPLNIHSQNWDQFFIAFLAIALFTSRIRERIRKSGLGLVEYLDKLNREYEINDSTTLILIQLGREKKEIHYFSKLTSFIRRWFKDYIERKEDRPSIVTFLDSLTTTSSNSKNKRLVASLREKLVFHLLKYNDINGKLLSQLIAIKVEDNLKAERPYGIAYAKQFFAKL